MKLRTNRAAIIAASIAASLALMLKLEAKSHAASEPKIIRAQHTCNKLVDPDGWQVSVWQPGYYCLVQDLYQSWPLIQFPHQRVPRSPLIGIYSRGATIDLQGHHLESRTPVQSGIFADLSAGSARSSTIIRNGSITTERIPTVRMVNNWNLENQRFGRNYPLSLSKGDLSKYEPTMFILENLTIKSGGHAIIMQGKRNIIRNCTIIGGNGTVNLYGPNLLFEGNTIILNAQTPKDPSAEPPVALYLEDAANSVVRDNKIIVKGADANTTAIVLANSSNVLLEHNTIRGTKTLYKLLDQRSSVREPADGAK